MPTNFFTGPFFRVSNAGIVRVLRSLVHPKTERTYASVAESLTSFTSGTSKAVPSSEYIQAASNTNVSPLPNDTARRELRLITARETNA